MLTIYTMKWYEGRQMEYKDATKVILWCMEHDINFLVSGPDGRRLSRQEVEQFVKGH